MIIIIYIFHKFCAPGILGPLTVQNRSLLFSEINLILKKENEVKIQDILRKLLKLYKIFLKNISTYRYLSQLLIPNGLLLPWIFPVGRYGGLRVCVCAYSCMMNKSAVKCSRSCLQWMEVIRGVKLSLYKNLKYSKLG